MLTLTDIFSTNTSYDNNILIKSLKNNNLLNELINYIDNVIISNCNIQDDGLEYDEIILHKKMFLNESVEITNKLSKILQKYHELYPLKIVNINKKIKWFTSEETICDISKTSEKNDNSSSTNKLSIFSENPFVENEFMSTVISIIWKLVDFTNEHYISNINICKRKIQYVNHQYNERIKNITDNTKLEYEKYLCEQILNKIKTENDDNMKNFLYAHDVFKIIRMYFLDIFNTMKYNDVHKYYLLKCTLNIFRSSITFIEADTDFVNFIIEFPEWLPQEFRCEYMLKLIKINNKSMYNNVKLNMAIDDVIYFYHKYLKEQSFYDNLITINLMLYVYHKMQSRNYELSLINREKLITFISINLSLISKLISMKEENDTINIDQDVKMLLFNINVIIKSDFALTNSYLIYHIYNTLYQLYQKYYNIEIVSLLNEIFIILLQNKFLIIYMAATLDGKINENVPLNKEQYDKFVRWSNIYKENIDDELIDPLTSTCIVEPCYISMNKDATMIQACDKYMLESYLWTKPENPFTREPLTITDLNIFNNLPHIKNNIKEFKCKLKEFFNKHN